MARNTITDELIIETSARLANEVGLDTPSLKMIAEALDIKSPSLYNHFSSLGDIKEKLMIYGWTQLGDYAIASTVGVSGYDALRKMCHAFYEYSTKNKGVFQAILWYNKFKSEEMRSATTKIFAILHKILEPLNISSKNVEHIIRTLRSFLEGFSLLVNNDAFGNPLSIKKSFDLSLDIIIEGIKSLEGAK